MSLLIFWGNFSETLEKFLIRLLFHNEFLPYFNRLKTPIPKMSVFKPTYCSFCFVNLTLKVILSAVLTCEGNPVVGSSGSIQDQNSFRRSDSDLLAVDLWHIRYGRTKEDRMEI